MYNELDNSTDGDEYNRWYHTFCDPFMDKLGDDNEVHKSFCLKLIRNLGHYSENFKFLKFKSEDCIILNNWIYNSMKKHKIPKNIITGCFDDYNDMMRNINQHTRCSYYAYDDIYEEPINIIILNIFESNMNIIQDTLDGEYDSIKFPLRKYICECIKIYKEMKHQYCPKSNEKSENSYKTCEMLNTFKNTYEQYLSPTQHKHYKIPSLDNLEEDYLTMCQSNVPRLALTPEVHEKIPVLDPTTQDIDRYSRALPPLFPVTDENEGSSMSSTVSTAFGTVAGASSILALLYKFTPGRKWIHSGFRGVRGRTSGNIYDEPNELLFDGMEHNDFNSYNIGYEAI
ncbi:VIR protein [Plasmodium vivax]|uniref:VIR protein n=1 Tax=Plasmodium vivax TaxID=5855 RepID=A0A1G4EAR7_PLAVI|nr:VIR protein [Plasmodium vivax]